MRLVYSNVDGIRFFSWNGVGGKHQAENERQDSKHN